MGIIYLCMRSRRQMLVTYNPQAIGYPCLRCRKVEKSVNNEVALKEACLRKALCRVVLSSFYVWFMLENRSLKGGPLKSLYKHFNPNYAL